jgi:hypothetical protein
MVGDGVNVGPALAGADLGLAIWSGTDVALIAADLILVRDNLSVVPLALRLARSTLGTIRGNLAWAFGYNVVAIPGRVRAAQPPHRRGGHDLLIHVRPGQRPATATDLRPAEATTKACRGHTAAPRTHRLTWPLLTSPGVGEPSAVAFAAFGSYPRGGRGHYGESASG